jgi:hypothetical protein
MTCASTKPCPQQPGPPSLQDFHNQHAHTAANVYAPTNKAELVAAIQQIEADGLTARAVGTDMALSRAGYSDDGVILTDKLNLHVLRPYGAKVGKLRANRIRPSKAETAKKSVDAVMAADVKAKIDPATSAPIRPRMVFVEGGIKIRQLLDDLSVLSPALAVGAMGALSRQSLVGALATGTHGSENDRQPLSDAFRSVYLVGPGGQEWWIERSNGWSDPALLRRWVPDWCNDTKVVYDDDLFYAALVGIGRLGVIYAVVLEVELDYWLLERRRPNGEPWPPVVAALNTSITSGYESPTGIFSTRGGINFLQIALNPNDLTMCWTLQRKRVARSTPQGLEKSETDALAAWCMPNASGWVDVQTKLDTDVRPLLTVAAAAPGLIPEPLFALIGTIGAEIWVNDTINGIKRILTTSQNLGEAAAQLMTTYPDLFKLLAGPLVNILVGEFSKLPGHTEANQMKRGRAFQVMDQTDYSAKTDCYYGIGSEYHFNAYSTAYLGFITTLFDLATAAGGIPGYISMRFVPQTDAYLGMERWPLTVAIEIGCLAAYAPSKQYLIDAQAAAIAAGGIPHWGQWLSEPVPTATLYKSSLDAYRLAVATIEAGHGSTFTSPFSATQALDPPAQPLSTIAAKARPRVSVKALLAAGQTLRPAAPAPTSVRGLAKLYKPSLRMNGNNERLQVGLAARSDPGVRLRDLARRLL